MADQNYEELTKRFKDLGLARDRLLAQIPEGGSITAQKTRELDRIINELSEFEVDLRRFASGNIEAVQALMGKNFIGPETLKEFLGAKDVGVVPNLPVHLTHALLESPCTLTNDGRKVYQTHRLIFIPKKLDGEDFTINLLRELATAAAQKLRKDTLFYNNNWHQGQDFTKRPLSQGTWILMPELELPNTRTKSDDQQTEELKKHPEYRTAKALELTTGLLMNCLQNDERLFTESYGRCEEPLAVGTKGCHVCVGSFSELGLCISYVDDGPTIRKYGRAVVRAFEKP